MTVVKYNVYLGKKKIGYVKSIDGVKKVLAKYPNAKIVTVADAEVGEVLPNIVHNN